MNRHQQQRPAQAAGRLFGGSADTASLDHIALLSEIDDLADQLTRWTAASPAWKPARRARALMKRLLERVDAVRIRLESPLVVATFGGTGTGKSSLVNALVGEEVSRVGRERPTTRTPVLLIHPDLEPEGLGLDLSGLDVCPVDAPVLRDIVMIDCPDPDTSEAATAGSNLATLRSLVPHCDVLLYTSTQQKYRSARIIEELIDAAGGCRLVFVQTHADLDDDIRADWRERLTGTYDVPELFFVDSQRALSERQEGRPPTGEFGRLVQLLSEELNASRRVEIRRANLVDLLQDTLTKCRSEYDERLPAVRELQDILDSQRKQLKDTLTRQLTDELLVNRNLWERRLLTAVTNRWGFSPFSAVLRFYNGLGALIASFTFFRARTSAQMALVGAVQGARWIRSRAEEQDAESRLDRLGTFGISDRQLQESRMIIAGYETASGIERAAESIPRDLTELRRTAASIEGEFIGDARRAIDGVIEKVADQQGGWVRRSVFELLFAAFLLFLLGRVGYNFFWSSFLAKIVGSEQQAEPLLAVDFYIPALLFLVIWSAILVGSFTMGMRRSLNRRVRGFAKTMADSRLTQGLFPALEATCREIEADNEQVTRLLGETQAFRRILASVPPVLGGTRGQATE